jgi:putative hemolysin
VKHGFSADRVADLAQHVLELGVEAEDALCLHGRAAKFLPETLGGVELLEQLRARSGRMVFVGDEYGVAQCVMTRAIY